MKKNVTPDNKHLNESTLKQVAKTLSRRNVIKSLMLIPFGTSLFQSVVKAQGTASPYASNRPIGIGQGLIPGRVSWVWNPAATNASCANLPVSAGLDEDKYDAWFMDKNTNQEGEGIELVKIFHSA